MASSYDVLVLGEYYCDLIFNGLPDLPRLGTDLFGTGFDIVPGASYRTALNFKRLGLRAGWLTDFGDDMFSRFVLEMAERDGLDSSLFRRHPFPVRRVSAAFSYVHDRGFISYTDALPQPDPVPCIVEHRPRAVLISSLEYGPAQAALAEAARAAGTLVYMDCQDGKPTLETPGVPEALGRVDVFAPNEVEALYVTGAVTVEAALDRLTALAPTVVIKRGAAGSVAGRGTERASAAALPIDVCDTTGAGDCFNAGFLYGLLGGRALADCLRCGNICGGLAAHSRDTASLPTAEVVERMLLTYNG